MKRGKKYQEALKLVNRLNKYTLDEAVDLVIRAIDEATGGELFIHKCPSFKVTDLAKAMLPDCELEDVGIRPGEKLHEVMITAEDSRSAYEYDDYYIIYQNQYTLLIFHYKQYRMNPVLVVDLLLYY